LSGAVSLFWSRGIDQIEFSFLFINLVFISRQVLWSILGFHFISSLVFIPRQVIYSIKK